MLSLKMSQQRCIYRSWRSFAQSGCDTVECDPDGASAVVRGSTAGSFIIFVLCLLIFDLAWCFGRR
jgi:hypothetical protein